MFWLILVKIKRGRVITLKRILRKQKTWWLHYSCWINTGRILISSRKNTNSTKSIVTKSFKMTPPLLQPQPIINKPYQVRRQSTLIQFSRRRNATGRFKRKGRNASKSRSRNNWRRLRRRGRRRNSIYCLLKLLKEINSNLHRWRLKHQTRAPLYIKTPLTPQTITTPTF